MITEMISDTAIQSYFQAALFFSNEGEDGEIQMDSKYTTDDFAEETTATLTKDITSFFELLESEGLLDDAKEFQSEGRIAVDFWLTRNGHGSGFWDGDYGYSLGDKITHLCKQYGEQDIYSGDDGKIYIM